MPELAKRVVDGLRPDPNGSDLVLWDSKIRSIGVRVKPSGVVSTLSSTGAGVERFQRDVTEGKTATDEKTGPRRRAIVRAVRPHDLRHGFAGVAVADGSSLCILGKVLGHTRARTTEKHAPLDPDPVRAVVDRTSRKIAAAMKGQGSGAVVPIVRRSS